MSTEAPHQVAGETEPIKIDPDATYTKSALASALGVSEKSIERWWKKRGKDKFPQPFKLGRTPLWRGKIVLNWFENRQSEALS